MNELQSRSINPINIQKSRKYIKCNRLAMDEIQGRSQPREREKICDRERKLFAVDSNISY
jgi:hypothetical protein